MPDSILNSPLTNPLLFRAAAILAPAGALDAAPLEVAVPYKSKLKLYCTYTRAAAGGSVDLLIQYAPRSADIPILEDWFSQTEYSAAVLAPGVDSTSFLQRELLRYTSTGAGAECFIVSLDIDSTVERVRVACREVGAVGNPGAVSIYGFAYSNQ